MEKIMIKVCGMSEVKENMIFSERSLFMGGGGHWKRGRQVHNFSVLAN